MIPVAPFPRFSGSPMRRLSDSPMHRFSVTPWSMVGWAQVNEGNNVPHYCQLAGLQADMEEHPADA